MRANEWKTLLLNHRLLAAAVGAAALSIASSQERPPPERPVGPPAGTPGKTGTASMSDKAKASRTEAIAAGGMNSAGAGSAKTESVELAEAIKAKVAATKEVDVKQLKVETRDGTVVLSGLAKTMTEKAAAGEIAKGVKGVKTVNNQITVRP